MSSPTAKLVSGTTRTRLAELEALVARSRRGRWLILSHDNPDPDALASAAVLGTVLRRHFGASVTLGYGGLIGRAENQAMVRALHLPFSHLRHLSWKNYSHFALVDTQPRTGNNQLPQEIVPAVVIDHHPVRRESASATFVDIRADYGATASIVTEYLLAAGLTPNREVATAVVYAIRSETQDFRRERPGPDRLLHDHLYPLSDRRALGKIQYPSLPLTYLQTLHEALENLEELGNTIICHLGQVDTPDNVPEIADLLLRLEGKTWCLATGSFEDRIYLAIRTTNPRADAGRAMRRILGRRGKGGGHGMLAGGWFPLDGSENPRTLQRRLAGRLLKILKKDPSRLSPIRLDQTRGDEDAGTA